MLVWPTLGAIIDMTHGYHSVLFMCIWVFRAHLHCLHRQDKAKEPAGTKNILKVGSPGAAVLHKLPPLHLTPGLSSGHQQHLLATEACTHQADAQPDVQHQHQEELQARDRSWSGNNEWIPQQVIYLKWSSRLGAVKQTHPWRSNQWRGAEELGRSAGSQRRWSTPL